MWNKIKGYVAAFVAGVVTILGVVAAILAGRKKATPGTDSGPGQREREIDVLIDGQRQAIDGSLERIERIENIVGSPEERQPGIDEAVERRKNLHERVKRVLGGQRE